MKKTSENTSARVATIAGEVLKRIANAQRDGNLSRSSRLMNNGIVYISIANLKTLAASVLTQTKDKKRK